MFAHNINKSEIKVYDKISLIVLYKTIYQALNVNSQAILKLLCEKINIKQFFLSYNNMNFYKRVQD